MLRKKKIPPYDSVCGTEEAENPQSHFHLYDRNDYLSIGGIGNAGY